MEKLKERAMAKAETQDMEQLVRWIIMEQFWID